MKPESMKILKIARLVMLPEPSSSAPGEFAVESWCPPRMTMARSLVVPSMRAMTLGWRKLEWEK